MSRNIDIFNGDADGICALTQLRNAAPCESTLITGVKRDIQLLDKVEVESGDQLTVLDVSLDKNRDGLLRVLGEGADVFYVDHHFAGVEIVAINGRKLTFKATDAYMYLATVYRKNLSEPEKADTVVQGMLDAHPRSADAFIAAAKYRLDFGTNIQATAIAPC